MNIRILLRFSLVALSLSGCATAPRAASTNAHPGFDLGIYPGEASLRAWREGSPYEWIGYYLPAPCHRETSWVGTRPALERQGWGIAILYVGQQLFETDTTAAPPGGPIICSRTLLTAERGRADGEDAIRRAESEGFARGSIVFLDVERMLEIAPEMGVYYAAWIDTLLRDGRYLPGTYAHGDNAADLYAIARTAFLQAGSAASPAFWVAGQRGGFRLDQPPYVSGFPFATVWQGVLDADRTWNRVTLRVDENVSLRRSPSAPTLP